jgi:hypothetical protein
VSSYQGPGDEPVSGWAAGGITFAACILILIGVFQFFVGLTAIIDDQFFVVGRHYLFQFDTTTWGWIHLLVGILLAATGFGLFARQAWAGVTAIVLVSLSALANFFFIPYYPLWAIVVIALDVWVIWALTRPGAIRT